VHEQQQARVHIAAGKKGSFCTSEAVREAPSINNEFTAPSWPKRHARVRGVAPFACSPGHVAGTPTAYPHSTKVQGTSATWRVSQASMGWGVGVGVEHTQRSTRSVQVGRERGRASPAPSPNEQYVGGVQVRALGSQQQQQAVVAALASKKRRSAPVGLPQGAHTHKHTQVCTMARVRRMETKAGSTIPPPAPTNRPRVGGT
jgi:hypothetical protein